MERDRLLRRSIRADSATLAKATARGKARARSRAMIFGDAEGRERFARAAGHDELAAVGRGEFFGDVLDRLGLVRA